MVAQTHYGVQRHDGKLFAYESGHFDFVPDISRAYLTNNLYQIYVAMQQATKEGHAVYPVEVIVGISPLDINEFRDTVLKVVRKQALAKLTEEERSALGLDLTEEE